MTTKKVEMDSSYVPEFINNEDCNLPDSEDGNGLIIDNVYIPEEVMIHILSYIEAGSLLGHSLVCRKWNNIIKSYSLWSLKFKREHDDKAKKLPWYIYYCILSSKRFDKNLVKNGNGQSGFKHWQFVTNGGDQCFIEKEPNGADKLPVDVPEFQGHSSCFATSFGDCHKRQYIRLGKSKLFRYVMDTYKPHIYLSEWTAGRFDCGCIFILRCAFIGKKVSNRFVKPWAVHHTSQWEGRKWEKIEMTITDYPEHVKALAFEDIGRDTQFWKGHFGSKMAGGVLKILSSSIEPLPKDEIGNIIPKKFDKIKYTCNGLQESAKLQFNYFLVFNNPGYESEEQNAAISLVGMLEGQVEQAGN